MFRIWGLTTDKAALAAHLAIDKGLNAQQVSAEILSRGGGGVGGIISFQQRN